MSLFTFSAELHFHSIYSSDPLCWGARSDVVELWDWFRWPNPNFPNPNFPNRTRRSKRSKNPEKVVDHLNRSNPLEILRCEFEHFRSRTSVFLRILFLDSTFLWVVHLDSTFLWIVHLDSTFLRILLLDSAFLWTSFLDSAFFEPPSFRSNFYWIF